MDSKTVYTKTAKGLREVTGKTSGLPRNLRNVLKRIDGKASAGELLIIFDDFSEDDLQKVLLTLIDGDYIREFIHVTASLQPQKRKVAEEVQDESLDFTNKVIPAASPMAKAQTGEQEEAALAKAAAEIRAAILAKERAAEEGARRQSEEKARKEAEAQAKRDAAEQARREKEKAAQRAAEAKEAARKDAEAQAKREAAEQARREAEETARRAAEEKARREAEEQAQRAAEAQEASRKEAEAQAKREAAEQARREAEETARRAAEEKARREAEVRARHAAEAEETARKKAEAQAKREAEEHARREAAEAVRRETEEKSRRESEVRARRAAEAEAEAKEATRKENEAQAKREAEEQARREEEEAARRAAEEKARREVEEQAWRTAEVEEAAEAQAKREAEEQARQEAEEAARRAAEEKARREAEEQARRAAEAEETARKKAAAQAKREAEAQTKRAVKAEKTARKAAAKEAREQARREAALESAASTAPAGTMKPYRKPFKWGKWISIGLPVLILVGIGLIHVVPFNERRAQFEQAATGQFQHPVTIKALHLSLVPRPHWRLEGITIGSEGQIKVAQIKATSALGALFDNHNVFPKLEIDNAVLNDEGLKWLLFGKPQQQNLRIAEVNARNIRLESKYNGISAFDARIGVDADGHWQKINLGSPEKKLGVELRPMAESVQFTLAAGSYPIRFGSALVIEDLSAKGVASPGELAVTEFSGHLYGGALSGNARLKWGAAWSLNGELNARQIDAARLAPGLMEEGKLDGRALYSARDKDADKLLAAPHLDGNFIVGKGTFLGVDLGNLLQTGGSGGKTSFAEIVGSFAVDNGQTQLRQLRLAAGAISATGNARADADNTLRGRFAVDLKTPGRQRNVNLLLSGTLKEPRFSRQ